MSFEEALRRLEEIVQVLERGELPLDEALAVFQEGIRNLRFCVQKLEAFEESIEVILNEFLAEAPPWLKENQETGWNR